MTEYSIFDTFTIWSLVLTLQSKGFIFIGFSATLELLRWIFHLVLGRSIIIIMIIIPVFVGSWIWIVAPTSQNSCFHTSRLFYRGNITAFGWTELELGTQPADHVGYNLFHHDMAPISNISVLFQTFYLLIVTWISKIEFNNNFLQDIGIILEIWSTLNTYSTFLVRGTYPVCWLRVADSGMFTRSWGWIRSSSETSLQNVSILC